MQQILSIKNLSKQYGKVKALDNVSFNVPKGCVYGILGPNGSGKTTTLGIILDILKANTGSFSWFETNPDNYKRKIGSLLETPNFYHYLSAVNNLKITQAISKRGNEDDIHEVLNIVNLAHRKNSKFSTYSLGMKQRLAIAAALLGNPDVLVLDEPTNGLDPVGIAEIRELIKKLAAQGKTIIMASHLLDEVEKVCTHVAILKKGNLLVNGNVNEVFAHEDIVELNAADKQALLNVLNNLSGYTKLVEEQHAVQLFYPQGTAELDTINKYCFDNGVTLNLLTYKKKSLEAKFLN